MTIIDLEKELGRKGARGSKPRVHLATHGTRDEVARYLTALGQPFAEVTPEDTWMPSGFEAKTEPQLHRSNTLIDPVRQDLLAKWWLPLQYLARKTPNFDIASTCKIDGKPGLLLVEAKAHAQEIDHEAAGRIISRKRRKGEALVPETPEELRYRAASHDTIELAIEGARQGFMRDTGLPWGISRDVCYQMSNRFAWSWKLTELGIPVVLIYLGFLGANEMVDLGAPFQHESDWDAAVRRHSAAIVPPSAWGQAFKINGETFVPLIAARGRSLSA